MVDQRYLMDDAMETGRNSDGNPYFDSGILDRLEDQKAAHDVGEYSSLLLDRGQFNLDAG